MKNKRINTFDVVVIIVIAAALVGLLIYINTGSSGEDSEVGDTATYVLEIGSTDQSVADVISVGDELVDITSKNNLGTVTDVEIRPAESLNIDYDSGEYVVTTIPDKVKVLLTVEAAVTEGASDILVEGVLSIKVSNTFSIQGPGYSSAASVINISRGEN